MSKKVLWALIILAVTVVVLIFNHGKVDVNLLFTRVSCLKSIAFLVFTGIGVAIGALLR
jgi:hypothetical protein